jgi:hypothetical protein
MKKSASPRVLLVSKIREKPEEVLEDDKKRLYTPSENDKTERNVESGDLDPKKSKFQFLITLPKGESEFPRPLEPVILYRYLTDVPVAKAEVIYYLEKIKRGQKSANAIVYLSIG